VLAIEPRGDNGGDEELGAVAGKKGKSLVIWSIWDTELRLTCWGQRWPWTGDQGECACGRSSHRGTSHRRWSGHRYPIPVKTKVRYQRLQGLLGKKTHVATGEVTTLEHELGNHTVEGRALVTLTLLGIAKLSEVPGSLGDLLVVEVEVDAASLG
jgi:hypothetical protein